MKKILVGMLAVLVLVISGCGDGSITVSGTFPLDPIILVQPPSIAYTSGSYTKDSINEYIDGSIRFYAPDSDIESMTVVAFNASGYEMSRTTAYPSLTGMLSGTIPFSIAYRTFSSSPYAYTFSVYLTDRNGYTSNQAVDSFYVP